MAKLVKHGSSIDRLSDLPDSILCHILSLMPTKYAVRTSVLSTRWRYLSTFVPNLYFEGNPSDDFMNFVDRVMMFHDTAACIERLSVRCVEFIDDSNEEIYAHRICNWITYAVKRHLQELCLAVSLTGQRNILPASLFTSKTLVKLELRLRHYDAFELTIPAKVCFPSLKTLHLEQVEFLDENSVQRLFSGCPVLEESFICSSWYEVWELYISNSSLKRLTISTPHVLLNHVAVDAPSLVYFKYSGILADSYSLVNLQSLVKADITYLFEPWYEVDRDQANNLLGAINNVQSLIITDDFFKVLRLYDDPLPICRNLVHLEISHCRAHDKCKGGLAKLLERAPKLRTLIFNAGVLECVVWRPPKTVPSCLLSHLKEIEIYSFKGGMRIIKYFLSNASVLERLKFEVSQKWKNHTSEIHNKLLMLPRESKMCQVELV